MITYAIFGKKENERFKELLQEKVQVKQLDGTVKNEYINSLSIANKVKQTYENEGYICTISKIDMNDGKDITNLFKQTLK